MSFQVNGHQNQDPEVPAEIGFLCIALTKQYMYQIITPIEIRIDVQLLDLMNQETKSFHSLCSLDNKVLHSSVTINPLINQFSRTNHVSHQLFVLLFPLFINDWEVFHTTCTQYWGSGLPFIGKPASSNIGSRHFLYPF